jgi:sec-independent protein translocase protein TatA
MFSGPWEWIIIVLVILLLFGGKKIPEMARGLGQAINEFKRGASEIKKEVEAPPVNKSETDSTEKPDEKK